jgi:pimeloyl-ACP methyl ester carboxylesterase
MRASRSLLVFLSITLAAIPAFAAGERPVKAVTEQGTIAGAEFRIDIPEKWNGGLVMYAHGYVLAGQAPPFPTEIVTAAGSLGFAVAQSRYMRQGWAVREGILDTEQLRRYFADKYGASYPTIIAGDSMGGAITYGIIEKFPDVYDGALPMCTTATPALEFMKERMFDMRLLFDYFFPGLVGSAVEFPDGPKTMPNVQAKAAELIKADPARAEAFAKLEGLSGPDAIPGTVAFWSEVLRELNERVGGNPFDNTSTIYSGTPDDATLNKAIKRYTADAKAIEYVRQWVTVTGHTHDPVLALHTLVDDLVPPHYANAYAAKAALAGAQDLFAMSYVNRNGHCNFSPEEVTRALRELDQWIKTGKRPVVGDWTKGK